ncbi:MAG: hypothetical protein C0478_03930 [Planctomyces sp.]|nr:hypothetical protein [Planctomyces sp.]
MFHFLRSLLPDSRMGLRHVFGLGVLLFLGSLPASWAIRTTLAIRELQSVGCHVKPVATWIDNWPGKLSTPIRVMVGGVASVEVDGKYLADSAALDRLIDRLVAFKPLQTLSLTSVHLTDQQMKRLCSANRVECLSFRDCQFDESPFGGMGDNPALRSILLTHSIRAGTQLEGIGKCRRLDFFYLSSSAMVEGDLQELGNCGSLRHVLIQFCTFSTQVELPEMRNLLSFTLLHTNLNCDALRKSSPNAHFKVHQGPFECRYGDSE